MTILIILALAIIGGLLSTITINIFRKIDRAMILARSATKKPVKINNVTYY